MNSKNSVLAIVSHLERPLWVSMEAMTPLKTITMVHQELRSVKHAAFLVQIKEPINEQDVELIPAFSM